MGNTNFKIYFSKSSMLPCVDFQGKLFKAKNLQVDVPTTGQWQPKNESPSWVLTGNAKDVIYDEDKDLIVIV